MEAASYSTEIFEAHTESMQATHKSAQKPRHNSQRQQNTDRPKMFCQIQLAFSESVPQLFAYTFLHVTRLKTHSRETGLLLHRKRKRLRRLDGRAALFLLWPRQVLISSGGIAEIVIAMAQRVGEACVEDGVGDQTDDVGPAHGAQGAEQLSDGDALHGEVREHVHHAAEAARHVLLDAETQRQVQEVAVARQPAARVHRETHLLPHLVVQLLHLLVCWREQNV